MTALFSDRYRPHVLLLLGAVLVALMGYWTWFAITTPEGYWAAVEEPAAWDGEPVVLTLLSVVEIPDERHFVLRDGDKRALVEGDSTDLALYDDVSVGGRFRASDGVLVAEWQERHPLRDGKRALGLIAVAFLVVAIPIWFTVRDGRIVERA